MNCVPLTSERPSLLARRIGSSPTRAERVAAGEPLALDDRLALADERQREVGERGEVAARPDRPARGHDREDTAVQALDEQLHRRDARSREALRERVRAQEHRRAHDLVRVRLADAARVAAQEAELELLGELLGDVRRDEAAEAGVDAVGVLAAASTSRSSRAARMRASRDVRELGVEPWTGDVPDVREA